MDKISKNLTKLLPVLPYIIISIGILLRITVYLQNNDLIIDEANIARNIYKRDFAGLARPLNYEQYAPPVFLWIIKLSSIAFGFSEYALTIFSFICGILSLWLMFRVLQKFTDNTGIWYALTLMATGFIYVRYSVELKQYILDVAISLSLILLTLKLDIINTGKLKFIILWVLTGSLVIWSSMPSVFMLAAIGVYYFAICLKKKNYKTIPPLLLIAGIWMLQFYYYYITILQPQADSEYLQRTHASYFLFLLPENAAEWQHNLDLSLAVLGNACGHWAIPVILHLLCIVVAIGIFIQRKAIEGLLLILPIALVFITACFHKYTLIPRAVLFIMPLILILIAVGMAQLFKIRFIAIRIIILAAAFITITNFNQLQYFAKRMEFEEVTQSLDFLKEHNVQGNELIVYHLANPAYVYYTSIHPNKEKYKTLAGATILTWDTDFNELGKMMKGRKAMLYNWEEETRIGSQQTTINAYCPTTERFTAMGSKVFIYTCRP